MKITEIEVIETSPLHWYDIIYLRTDVPNPMCQDGDSKYIGLHIHVPKGIGPDFIRDNLQTLEIVPGATCAS